MDRDHPVDGIGESQALTGLRALAALLVMVHHFYLHLAIHQHLPMLQWLLRKGYLGVDLFFVISGFVITMVYGHWFDGTRPGHFHTPFRPTAYLRFLVRRVARLWPLHATLILAVLLGFLARDEALPSLRMIGVNLAMMQAWGISAEINAPAWSVSTEFLAYLLFPALAWLSVRGRAGPLVCLALVVAAFTACMMLSPPLGLMRRGRLDIYTNYSILPALRCLAGFTVGMLCWRAGRMSFVRRMAATAWLGPLALFALVFMMLGRVNDLVIFTTTMPLLVLGMHFGRGPIHRLLSQGPIHELGVLSYATYLIHFPLLFVFPFAWAQQRYTLPAYLVTTIALAYLAHRLIERPGRWTLRILGESLLARLPLSPKSRHGQA